MDSFLDRRLDQLGVVGSSQLAVKLTGAPQLEDVLAVEVHLSKTQTFFDVVTYVPIFLCIILSYLRHVSHETRGLRRNDLFLLDPSKVNLPVSHVEALRSGHNLGQDRVILVDSQSDLGASSPAIFKTFMGLTIKYTHPLH